MACGSGGVAVRLLEGVRGVPRRALPREVLAGVTLAALAIPLNIGYAQIAGLPPAVGLYTAIVPMIVFAVFSSSRQLVASPDAPIAALIAALLGGLAAAGGASHAEMAAALALLCAVVFACFWAFRLGFLANFLSEPVLVGFIAGLAVEILTSQVEKILAVDADADGYFAELWELITGIPQANGWSVLVGVGTILLILAFRRLAPALPGPLLALVAATAAVALLGLGDRGVSVLGEVPSGLPPLGVPDVSLGEVAGLVPGAIAICAVTLADGLLTARRYAERHGYPIDANRELLAFGTANVAAGFTGGFVVGSSASRTAAMDATGSRSQIPSIVCGVTVAVVVLTLSGVLADLPNPALAGIVTVAVVPLFDVRKLARLYRERRSDFLVAVVCLVAVPVLGSLTAVVIAVLLSVVDVVRRAAHPDTALLTSSDQGRFRQATGSDAAAPGLVVYRFGAALFFANTQVFKNDLTRLADEQPDLRWLLLDAEAVSDIDTTGAAALRETVTHLQERGVTFGMTRVTASLHDLLDHYGLVELIGTDHFFDSNRSAADAYQHTIGHRSG